LFWKTIGDQSDRKVFRQHTSLLEGYLGYAPSASAAGCYKHDMSGQGGHGAVSGRDRLICSCRFFIEKSSAHL
jgi:hypothetical protein